VLGDPTRKAMWEKDCRGMAERLNTVRKLLFDALVKHNVKGEWNHVIEQRGMFSYTGLTAATVSRLKQDYHIYLLSNGRISLAGLNTGNVERFVAALIEILGTN
jgi:aspartate/tyrosine/aromatic aminotransferase